MNRVAPGTAAQQRAQEKRSWHVQFRSSECYTSAVPALPAGAARKVRPLSHRKSRRRQQPHCRKQGSTTAQRAMASKSSQWDTSAPVNHSALSERSRCWSLLNCDTAYHCIMAQRRVWQRNKVVSAPTCRGGGHLFGS